MQNSGKYCFSFTRFYLFNIVNCCAFHESTLSQQMPNFQRSKSSNSVYCCWKCTFWNCPIQLHYSSWWFSSSLPKPLGTLDRVHICLIAWRCSICQEECSAGYFSSYTEWHDEGQHPTHLPSVGTNSTESTCNHKVCYPRTWQSRRRDENIAHTHTAVALAAAARLNMSGNELPCCLALALHKPLPTTYY
jgi:hypothetical protein